MQPQYKTWRDKADNIGVQCTECHRTFWTGREPTIDPTTGQDCINCLLIKTANVLETVNADKQIAEDGSSPHPFTQPGNDVVAV